MIQKFTSRALNIPPSFIREILKVASSPGVISFAGGLPNADLFPAEELKICADRVLSKNSYAALQYNISEGYPELRQWVAQYYKRHFDLDLTLDEIIITNGSQQALDLIGKLFIEENDTVLVEQPTYLGAIQSFSPYMPLYREAKLETDGICIDEASAICELYHPKLAYLIPNYQNPSGTCYSEEKRLQLATLLKKHNVLLVEDDPYREINFTNHRPTPFKKIYKEGTITLGSFSKMIAPGLRLGWIIAPKEVARQLTILKQASDLHTNMLGQLMICEFVNLFDLEAHTKKISLSYSHKCEWMIHCIDKYLPAQVSYNTPEGGMFLWLDTGTINARELLKLCMTDKVVFVPGDAFYTSATNDGAKKIRFNFTNSSKQQIETGIQIISKNMKYFISDSILPLVEMSEY
jgi:2-aminoadipate transaminase